MARRKKTETESGPPKKSLYTIKLEPEQIQKLGQWMEHRLWAPFSVDHAVYAYKGDDVNVVAYKSGKVVIQGKKTEDFVTYVLEGEITGQPEMGYEEVHHPEWFEPHAGVDESGKGDLFGPLVSACVIADGDHVREWMDKGLRESKRVSGDNAVLALEKIIRGTKGVVIKSTWAGMRKYNELHGRFGYNVNKLLAWMHATSVMDALKVRPVEWGMLDQFSKQPLTQRQLRDVGDFELKMQTKAEEDPVVAAASIVARAEYIRQMHKLEEKAGMKLSKGASALVKEQGRAIVEKFGADALGDYAKMHFRTAAEILEG